MEKITVQKITEFLHARLEGNSTTVITGIAGIQEAAAGDITFLENQKYTPLLATTKASAVIVAKDFEGGQKPDLAIIKTENPSLAFSRVVSLLYPDLHKHPQGIHPSAVIDRTATLEKNVAVGAHTIISKNARVGDNAVIYGNCFIGDNAIIGGDALIYPTVTIRENCSLGKRVTVHSGTVIGSDGFGYASVKGIHHKIPQVGTVVIEDDVEIGANVTIDRARFDTTIIGQGTKIDNLVQIAHNVKIGKNCLIIAQAGISGSTVVEDNVIIAGQAGIVGHITIGERSIIAAQAGVTKSVPKGITVSGYPARPHDSAKRVNACVQRLPELCATINALEKKIQALEEAIHKK